MDRIEIEYHVFQLRHERNLSVRELADKSGVSKTQINDIENGRGNPTVYALCLLSLALNVSPYELFSLKS